MNKFLLIAAAIAGGLAVALGAFGAHGLKKVLDPYQLDIFEKAVKYMFIHTLAVFAAVYLFDKSGSPLALYGGLAFLAGIVLFSGSLYLLATKYVLHIESWSWLGPITPVGGLCFIAGWILLALAAFKI